MLGGRPLQNIAAELHGDAKSWTRRPAGFSRAGHDPGVAERQRTRKAARPAVSRPRSTSNSSDPDALVAWLQGRGEVTYRSQKPLRLRGDVSVAPDRFAIDAMKAEIDGGAVEGRVAVSHRRPTAARGSMRS